MSSPFTNGRSYKSRSWFLKKLGFSSYREYLKSDLWKSIRDRVFALKGHDCHLCGRYATQLHHTRYHEADLVGRKTKHIHPICGICHKQIEFTESQKNTVTKAKKLFKQKRKERREIEHLKALFL